MKFWCFQAIIAAFVDNVFGACFVFISIQVAIQSQIYVAQFYFFQIHMACGKFVCRDLLKNKRLEKFAKQRIGPYVMAKHGPFFCEFALHAAYENSYSFHILCFIASYSPQLPSCQSLLLQPPYCGCRSSQRAAYEHVASGFRPFERAWS